MLNRLALPLILLVLFAAGCNPQPLPIAPTPIPVLIPATLPVQVDMETALGAGAATPDTPSESSETGDAGTSTAADLALGQQVWETRCSVCHNLNAQTKVGPGLAGVFAKAALPNGNAPDDAGIGEWITVGGGSMPGVPLAGGELAWLISYLRDATK